MIKGSWLRCRGDLKRGKKGGTNQKREKLPMESTVGSKADPQKMSPTPKYVRGKSSVHFLQ